MPAPEDPGTVDSPDANLTGGLFALALALLFWASPSIIAKTLPLGSIEIVFYRGWLGVFWSLLALHVAGGRLSKRALRVAFWGGVALGLDLIFFFTALKLTTVANATVITAMQPVLLVFVAPLLFGERLRLPDIAAALVAIGGAVLVVLGSQGTVAWSPRGDFFAVITVFAWTAYLVASKRARVHLRPTEFTAAVMLIAALVITPLALGQQFFYRSASPIWPSPLQWLGLAAMALFAWCGHVLMSRALAHVPIWVGGTSALAIPVVTSALAVPFLGERLVTMQIAGMAIAIASLVVVGLRSRHVLNEEPSSEVAPE